MLKKYPRCIFDEEAPVVTPRMILKRTSEPWWAKKVNIKLCRLLTTKKTFKPALSALICSEGF